MWLSSIHHSVTSKQFNELKSWQKCFQLHCVIFKCYSSVHRNGWVSTFKNRQNFDSDQRLLPCSDKCISWRYRWKRDHHLHIIPQTIWSNSVLWFNVFSYCWADHIREHLPLEFKDIATIHQATLQAARAVPHLVILTIMLFGRNKMAIIWWDFDSWL